MVKINKDITLNTITIITSIFLCNSLCHASLHDQKQGLRVPFSDYERPEEAARYYETKEDSTSEKALKGPFRIPNTTILYNVTETEDPNEISKILDKWFASRKERTFSSNNWEIATDYHPGGVLTKLESEHGQLLGISYYRKELKFMFSRDDVKGDEDIDSVYFGYLAEISDPYRKKGLGQVIIAKQVERALNDPDIKDRIQLFEPASKKEGSSKRADEFLDEKIGAEITYITSDLGAMEMFEEEEWRNRHRLLRRHMAEELVKKVKNKIISEQGKLFSEEALAALIKEKKEESVQLELFLDTSQETKKLSTGL